MISNANFLKRERGSMSKLYLMLEAAYDEPKYYSMAAVQCQKIICKLEKRFEQVKQYDIELSLFDQNIRSFQAMIKRVIAAKTALGEKEQKSEDAKR